MLTRPELTSITEGDEKVVQQKTTSRPRPHSSFLGRPNSVFNFGSSSDLKGLEENPFAIAARIHKRREARSRLAVIMPKLLESAMELIRACEDDASPPGICESFLQWHESSSIIFIEWSTIAATVIMSGYGVTVSPNVAKLKRAKSEKGRSRRSDSTRRASTEDGHEGADEDRLGLADIVSLRVVLCDFRDGDLKSWNCSIGYYANTTGWSIRNVISR